MKVFLVNKEYIMTLDISAQSGKEIRKNSINEYIKIQESLLSSAPKVTGSPSSKTGARVSALMARSTPTKTKKTRKEFQKALGMNTKIPGYQAKPKTPQEILSLRMLRLIKRLQQGQKIQVAADTKEGDFV